MTKAPVKIDNLLEPLLSEISDEQADELLLRLITVHADPVIKSVIRYKLRLPPYGATERAESDDVHPGSNTAVTGPAGAVSQTGSQTSVGLVTFMAHSRRADSM